MEEVWSSCLIRSGWNCSGSKRLGSAHSGPTEQPDHFVRSAPQPPRPAESPAKTRPTPVLAQNRPWQHSLDETARFALAVKISFSCNLFPRAVVQYETSVCRMEGRDYRLTGSKAYFHGKSRAWHGFLPAVAVVCLLLLALLAVAQVAHQHANSTDADHCQLCIVMHTVAPVGVAAVVIVMEQLGPSAPQAEPIVVVRQRQSRLFIRPPPGSC